MSKYTISIKDIVYAYNQNNPNQNQTIYQKIEYARPKIFDFDYNFYNLNDKTNFENLFIQYFLIYEIGFDTIDLFKLYLCNTLNLIMPYYTQLYNTTLYDYNLNGDINITEIGSTNKNTDTTVNGQIDSTLSSTSTGSIKSNGNSTTVSTNDGTTTNADTTQNDNLTSNNTDTTTNTSTKNLQSDLPQANYNGLDYGTVLNEGTTNTTQNSKTTGSSNTTIKSNGSTTTKNTGNITVTDNNTTDTTDNNNGTTNQTNTQKGNEVTTSNNNYHKSGITGNRTHAEIIQAYRDIITNINYDIIKSREISNLFLKIF